MPQTYPVQLLHAISDNEFNLTSDLACTKLLRFQQTAKRGEKFLFSDTGNEYVALNDAGDMSGSITAITDGGSGMIIVATTAPLPSIGDTIQIMSSDVSAYVGTSVVSAIGTGTFTIADTYTTNATTGYWKREATLLKVISTKTVDSETLTTSTNFVTTEDMLGKVIEINNDVNAITITLQDFIDKGIITFILRGTGAVTFATIAPSTILSDNGKKRLIVQYCSVTVVYSTTTDAYTLIGKLNT